jgi:hypothetical protein
MISMMMEAALTNLRDTLLVHSSVEHRPCYSAGILALEEKRFGFAILETEDLAVASNVELALICEQIVSREIQPAEDGKEHSLVDFRLSFWDQRTLPG